MVDINRFDRRRIADESHPKSIATSALFTSLTQYTSITPDPLTHRTVSPQCRAIELRYQLMVSGGTPPTADGKAALAEVQAGRDADVDAYEHPTPAHVHIDPVTLGKKSDVQCYWIYTDDMHTWRTGPFILYFHGGAYMYGGIYTYSGIAWNVARSFNMPLLFVDYTLAPEALFPSQRDEALEVHRALLEIDGGCASRMITYGDSAGGGLSVVHTQTVIAAGLAPPALCISVSGYFDTLCTGDSYDTNWPVERLFSRDECHWWFAQCVGGYEHKKLLETTPMNPFNGTFKQFPPSYICCGGAEVLLSDTEMCVEKMKADGVDVTMFVVPHMFHSWLNFCERLPEATVDMARVVAWVKSKLKSK